MPVEVEQAGWMRRRPPIAANSYPVGRAVQAAVCKTAQAGATPARDSILSGIGVERHTPVFQTGVEGALPSCPSISQVNLACRQRPRTVEVMAGRQIRCAWDFFYEMRVTISTNLRARWNAWQIRTGSIFNF